MLDCVCKAKDTVWTLFYGIIPGLSSRMRINQHSPTGIFPSSVSCEPNRVNAKCFSAVLSGCKLHFLPLVNMAIVALNVKVMFLISISE